MALSRVVSVRQLFVKWLLNVYLIAFEELGHLLRHVKMGEKVKECLNNLPNIEIDTSLHPITRTVLRVKVTLKPNFKWNDAVHGMSEPFWVWIEDPFHNHIYHHEFFSLLKKHVRLKEEQHVVFTIPIFEPLPPQYIVRLISDRWLGVEFSHSISFKHLILPDQHPPHTELLGILFSRHTLLFIGAGKMLLSTHYFSKRTIFSLVLITYY